jgi:hypothetical protein
MTATCREDDLVAKDALRRVIFGLERVVESGKVVWTINFQLFERKKKLIYGATLL